MNNPEQPVALLFRRFWWVILVGVIIVVAVGTLLLSTKKSSNDNGGKQTILDKVTTAVSGIPACPADLSGILKAPLMDPQYISALTPLGNINPPGHTSPVDHIYFATNYDGQIPLYAPADARITKIIQGSVNDGSGTYIPTGYVVTYTVCDGLVLDFASYTDVIQPIKDELAKQKGDCKYGITKPGHENAGEGQCGFNLDYSVKSGDEIGWVKREKKPRSDQYDLPFEIWAADYNKPARSDVNWSYYNDDRYAHSMCTFDLYDGELKDQFMGKFGGLNDAANKDPATGKIIRTGKNTFVPRTVEPRCGQVNQDIVGTIQGMWFAGSPSEKENIEFAGGGLAFLHNNLDPTIGEVSIGGTITTEAGILMFTPSRSNTTNREPSDVRADGTIYCYTNDAKNGNWDATKKVLVQLVDDHHLKAESQIGNCSTMEKFKNSFSYER